MITSRRNEKLIFCMQFVMSNFFANVIVFDVISNLVSFLDVPLRIGDKVIPFDRGDVTGITMIDAREITTGIRVRLFLVKHIRP